MFNICIMLQQLFIIFSVIFTKFLPTCIKNYKYKDKKLLSKVKLVKIAPPFKLVGKTTNLLVHIHYIISSFLKTTNDIVVFFY